MKLISFSTYKKIKGLSLNDFNRWAGSVYKSGFSDGVTWSEEDVVSEISEDELLDVLLSVKGIGQKRAEEAVEKILAIGRKTEVLSCLNEEKEKMA